MSVRILSFVLVSSLVACSSASSDPVAPTDSGTTDSANDSAADSGTPEDTGTGPCSEPAAEIPAGSQCVKVVTGKVLDTTGAPLVGKTVSVCGNICYTTDKAGTHADGSYSIAINSHIVLGDFAASVHGRPDYASLIVKLPATTAENFALPDMVVPKLPASGEKIPMDDMGKISSAKTIASGDLSLSFQAGTTAELDLEDVAEPETGTMVRAVKVEAKDYPPFAKDAGVTVLFALTPFQSKYDKKVGIKIANTGIADGPVEFVIVGDDYLKKPFTAGLPQVVASGTVSGGTATTTDGEGTSLVTWVGVRAKK